MNAHGILRSLVWKDYRELRVFWLATLLLAVGLEVFAGLMVTRFGMAEYAILPTLAYALVTPGLYALGCAAMMFAGEQESGMYHLLRALPVDPRRLLLSRAAYVLASTLLMLVATCGAFLVVRRMMGIEMGNVAAVFGLFAIVPIEFFVWGVLMSLVCRRPLSALILGAILGTCAGLAGCSSGTWVYELFGQKVSGPEWWPVALAVRMIIVSLVAMLDLRLASRWFNDGSILGPRKRPSSTVTTNSQSSADSRRLSFTTKTTTELGRLLWQQWRQSRRLVGVFALAAFLLGFLFVVIPRSHNDPEAPGALLMLLLVPLAGVCAFREDWQGRRFRFLAQCGARPGRVWWSRQLVWLGVSLAILLVAMVLYGIPTPEDMKGGPSIRYDEIRVMPIGGLVECVAYVLSLLLGAEVEGGTVIFTFILVLLVLAMLTGYACGQFCSIYTRSSIMAGIAAFGLLLLIAIWISLMTVLWIDWLWSVVPIPFVLLLATRLRVRDWMLERTDWRARSKSVLVPMVPLLAILVAVPFHRVYSVPKVELNLPVVAAAPRPSAEELATGKLYQKAYATYVPLVGEDYNNPFPDRFSDLIDFFRPGKECIFDQHPLPEIYIERLKANQKTIDTILSASRRPKCALRDGDSVDWIIAPRKVQEFGYLLVASARHLTTQGKLDDALERYLAAMRVAKHLNQAEAIPIGNYIDEYVEWGLLCWAAHPDQTAERIDRALKKYTELYIPSPTLAHDILKDWCHNRQLLTALESWHGPKGQAVMDDPGNNFTKAVQAMVLKRLPWERTRAQRVMDYFAHHELEKIQMVESALSEGRRVVLDFDDRPRMGALVESTFLGKARPWLIDYSLSCFVSAIARERAFRLQMALAAWRREHGDVPKSLDELVGKYLDAVPIDPFTGEPFRYIPEGVPRSVIEKDEKQYPMETISPDGSKLADQYPLDGLGPFVCSPGWQPDMDAHHLKYWGWVEKQGEDAALARWRVLREGNICPVP